MPSARRKAAPLSRASRTRNPNSSSRMAKRFTRLQTQTYSHIQIQPAAKDLVDQSEDMCGVEKEPSFSKKSLQTELEENSVVSHRGLEATASSTGRPATFAGIATMSARRVTRSRKDTVKKGEDDTFDAIAGPVNFESLGPFKYTFKRKKTTHKIQKWTNELKEADSDVGEASNAELKDVKGASEGSSSSTTRLAEISPISSIQTGGQHQPFPEITAQTTFLDTTTVFQVEEPVDQNKENKENKDNKDNKGNRKSSGGQTALKATIPEFVPRTPLTLQKFKPPTSEFTFSAPAAALHDHGEGIHITTLDELYGEFDDKSDTQSTKDRLMAQIARSFDDAPEANQGDDGFDTMEWDPNLPAPEPDENDPEPLVATPQPVTYTTVGSRVNPDAVPQFTAPNRIQREGSGRRGQTLTRDHHDTLFTRRSAPSALTIASSMQYTQQYTQPYGQHLQSGPAHTQNGTPSSLSRSSTSRPSAPSEKQTYEELLRLQSLPLPRVRPGNVPAMPKRDASANKVSPTESESKSQFSAPDEPIATTNKVQKELPGMEKMQTLQRMAKYDNPFQSYARSRLLDFSATRSQAVEKPVANPPSRKISFQDLLASDKQDKDKANGKEVEVGQLNRAYQFPPPGLPHPGPSSLGQTNPLMAALEVGGSQATPYESSQTLRAPPGYPQPLTAGPPGQRSSAVAFHKTNRYIESLWENDGPNLPYPRTGSTQATSPWMSNYISEMPFSQHSTAGQREFGEQPTLGKFKDPIDTLSVSERQKYYPNGFPGNMDQGYTPLSMRIRSSMDRGEPQLGLRNARPKTKAEKDKELSDWFYQGQRRYAMTADDHISELQERHQWEVDQRQRTNPLGPIGPPPKKVLGPVKDTPYTMTQMKNMSTAKASEPLLDAAFGSLLGYAEKGPNSRSHLSQFKPSPQWQIDDSEKGNNSFFGEDWGKPPKRFGRDPRFQPPFNNPSTSKHWE